MTTTHYFNQSKNDTTQTLSINANIVGQRVSIQSASGLFSATTIDKGTTILLKSYKNSHDTSFSYPLHVLDLGCGYGIVAYRYTLTVSQQHNQQPLVIDACDSSPLAVEITKYNLARLSSPYLHTTVQESDVLSHPYFKDKSYNIIFTNPPFSTGKQKVQEFLTQAYTHLAEGGELRVVAPTQRWAKWYIEFCKELFWESQVEVIILSQGFRVWKSVK